jgi:hypothetical protein
MRNTYTITHLQPRRVLSPAMQTQRQPVNSKDTAATTTTVVKGKATQSIGV